MEPRALQCAVPVEHRSATRESDQGLHVGVGLLQMSKAIPQKRLIVVVEAMVQTRRNGVLPSWKGEQSPIFFELIDDELVQSELSGTDKGIAAGGRVNGQNALQSKSAGGGRKKSRGAAGCEIGDARNQGISRIICQRSNNRQLRSSWCEDIALRQQRN